MNWMKQVEVSSLERLSPTRDSHLQFARAGSRAAERSRGYQEHVVSERRNVSECFYAE